MTLIKVNVNYRSSTTKSGNAQNEGNKMNFTKFSTKRLVRIIKRIAEYHIDGENVMIWDDCSKQFVFYCTTEDKEILAAIVAHNEAVKSKSYIDHEADKKAKFERGEIDVFTFLMKDEMTPVHPDFVKYKKK